MSYRASEADWQAVADDGNYIVRHWRGHLSLPVSYWINAVLIPGIYAVAGIVVLEPLEASDLPLSAVAFALLLYLAIGGALWVWSMVGVWRSAGFHESRGGSSGWATIARVVVVISLLGAAASSHDKFLFAAETAQLAVGSDPIGDAAKLELQPDGKSLLLDGNLTAGTASRFEAVLAAHPNANAVLLRSHGGRTREAERIARLIASRQLSTEVIGHCSSACTLVLLAGKQRSVRAGARVGFHQPSFPGLSAEDQRLMTADLRAIYESQGVSSAFLDKALGVPPQSMWFPDRSQLFEANVITGGEAVVVGESDESLDKRRREQLKDYLEYSARQLNSASPRKLDEITTRTGATAAGSTMTITFQLHLDADEVDAAQARPGLTEILTEQTCVDDVRMKRAVQAGATFVFKYEDRGGQPILKVEVSNC